MTDFDEEKKKTSPLMTCAIIAAVVGIGGISVVGIGGFFAYRHFFGGDGAETPSGLLTVVSESAGVTRVVCSSAADSAWTVSQEVPVGGTREISILPRPAACVFTYGADAQESTTWFIADPPDSNETWMVRVQDAAPVVAVEEVPVEPVVPVETLATVDPAPVEPVTPPPAARATTPTTSSRSTSTRATTPAEPEDEPVVASSGSGGGSRSTAPAPAAEEEDEELPDGSVLAAVKVEWAKGARKSTPWTMVLDGKKVGPVPAKSLVSSGTHKLKLTATGEDPLECTLAASGGEDIVVYFDPAKPQCP